METIDPIVEALKLRNWYAFAALALTFAIQLIRKNPNWPVLAKLKALWNKTPVGYRFLWPTTIGAVTAFVAAFEAGVPLTGALLAAVGGALGIGVPSMGVAAMLRESPIPWDGKKGGMPKEPDSDTGGPDGGAAVLVRIIPPRLPSEPPPTPPRVAMRGSDILPRLTWVLAMLVAFAGCATGSPPTFVPTSLPPGDPCARETILAYSAECTTRAVVECADAPDPCVETCKAEIRKRCQQ